MEAPMNPSCGRARGDLSGAKFCGRVDVYFEGVTQVDSWGRKSVKHETYWTPYGDGDASGLADEVAARLGGKVRSYFFDPLCNGGKGHTWYTDFDSFVVVVPKTSK